MRYAIAQLLAIAMLCAAYYLPARADEPSKTYFKYGLGVFNSAQDSAVEVKTLAFGRQVPILKWMLWQYEAGGWGDSRADMGRASSLFVDTALGINVDVGYFYAQSLWGVAALSAKDSYLGSHAQFNHDLGVGIKDGRGVSIGLAYKHFSSAGIFMPNKGRDFVTVQLGIPW